MRLCVLIFIVWTVPLFARQTADVQPPPQDTVSSANNALLLRFRISAYDLLRQSLIAQPPVELDSSVQIDPSLRPALLRERLTSLPPPDDISRTHMSMQQQLLEMSRLPPFEASSLALKRQQELFGHQPELRNRFYQTDIMKLLEWLMGLFR